MNPQVAVITTGGTIGCQPNRATGTLEPGDSASQLLEAAGSLSSAVRHIPYANVFGTALGPSELQAIALLSRRELEDERVAGVVVTAGTGIIEEGAYLSELLNVTDKPVVWTGAQYAAAAPDSDGPRNVRNAVRAAASPGARTCGARALVCFNQALFAARDVSKHHTTSVATFTAYERGVVGLCEDEGLAWLRCQPRRRAFPGEELTGHVDLVKLVAGSDGRFIDASVASGARAIVIEGFPGTGMVCPGVTASLERALARDVWLVLGTRSPSGSVAPRYGGELGAATWAERGVLLGGDLSAPKLRLLMMVLLAQLSGRQAIRRAFSQLTRVAIDPE